MRQKSALFWPKLDASYFPKREFCGNVDQPCYGLTFVSQHAMSFQKKCHRADHQNKVA